jgi:putative toxin-antitoxin system antitoxin component (TIGR02293 family)
LLWIYLPAEEVFQCESKAAIWLKSPNHALGDVAPTTLLDTIAGIKLVLDELGRIEHDIFI